MIAKYCLGVDRGINRDIEVGRNSSDANTEPKADQHPL